MSDSIPAITVSSGGTRPSQRAQLDTFLAGVREREEAVIRIRIPVTFYTSPSRGYTDVREAAWNLQLPSATTAGQIEDLIQAVGACIEAIAKDGSDVVRAKLEEPPQ